jgi:hypothetical protein
VIKVRLMPVEVLEPGVNARVNRQKARAYALQGLLRHLTAKAAGELTVEGARVTAVGRDGKFFTMTLEAPRDGVSTEPAAATARAGTRLKFVSRFDRIIQDHEETIQELTAALAEEVKELQDRDRTVPGNPDPRFATRLQQLQTAGLAQWDSLEKSIGGDLTISRLRAFGQPSPLETLMEKLKPARRDFRERLEDARKRHEKYGQKPAETKP